MPLTAAKNEERPLQEVLQELEASFSTSTQVAQLLSKTTAMSIAVLLRQHPYKKQIGRGLLYRKLLGKLAKLAGELLRRNRTLVLSELQELLRLGPDRYYTQALRDLSQLNK